MPVKSSKVKIQKSKVVKVSKTTSRIASAPSKNISGRTLDTSIVRAKPRTADLSVPVYSLAGRTAGTLSLPKEIFGQKVNKKLLAQAIRVYSTSQKSLFGSTKTRGEVEGSTAKIFRQRGTGRARHGSVRAPIFVGGGIVFGPTPRKVRLELPQRMKKAALFSALSAKTGDKQIRGLSGLEKASGKTKEMAKLMYQVSSSMYQGEEKKNKKMVSALIITSEKMDNIVKSVRNIPGTDVLPVNLINAYEIVKHNLLLITKEAVEKLTKPEIKEQK